MSVNSKRQTFDVDDQYEENFEEEKSQYSSFNKQSSRREPIAQDIQAPDVIEDFPVHVPSQRSSQHPPLDLNPHDVEDESYRPSESGDGGLTGLGGGNSVQVVDDNYYIEDDFDDHLPKQDSKVSDSRKNSTRQKFDDDDDDYEF